MNSKQSMLCLAILSVGLMFLIALPSTGHAVSPMTQGYVKYNITLTNNTQTKTFTISETVQPSSTSGHSVVTVTITMANSNLTYSHLINSSRILFPIVPISNSETFNYQFQGLTFHLTVTKTGTSTTIFNDNSIQLTNYDFTGSIMLPSTFSYQYGNIQMNSVHGQLSLLPSDLLYSLQTSLSNNMSLKIQLASTSIALDMPAQTSLSTSQVILYGSVASGVIAIGLGAFYALRRLMHHKPMASPATEKPSYWVD